MEAVADLHGVEPSEVLITPGGKFGIAASIYKAGSIGVIAPYWPAYRMQAEVLKTGFRVVAESRMEDSWVPRDYSLDGVDTLVINYPNNPTGALPRSFLRDLLDDASRRGVRIVSDEVYRDLVYSGGEWSALDHGIENRVIVYSFSKTFSIPGFRIGYVVGDRSILREVARFIQATYTSTPKPMQAAALRALEIRDEVVAGVRRVYMERIEAFNKHSGGVLEYVEPVGGMYIFARVNPPVDDTEFVYRLADEGVGAFPGSAFGSAYKGFVRITLTVPPSTVPRVIDAFKRAAGG